MYHKYTVLVCIQVFLFVNINAFPFNGPCNGIRSGLGPSGPIVATGNAVTTATALSNGCNGPISTQNVGPLVTEIVPSLQLGDITVGGDIPIGGTIKVSGYIPVYGLVSLDGAVPSAGTAAINAGGGLLAQVVEPTCRVC